MPGDDTRARTPFVGRALELHTLDEGLRSAAAGGSPVVIVTGDPGIGKTRLLSELRERARRHRFQAIAGRAGEIEQDTPYVLFADALEEALHDVGPEVLRRLGPERLVELAAIVPALPPPGDSSDVALEVERFRTHRAVRAAVAELARARPLLITLDDVHWADPASLELASHLLTRRVRRCLLALAYRPRRLDRRLRAALDAGSRDGNVSTVALSPFSVEESAQLLDLGEDSPAVGRLHAASGGNPFYLEQLARHAGAERERGPLDPHTTMPIGVRDAIASELAGVSADARRLAEGAAVAGDRFEFDLAAEIGNVDAPAALVALDELIAADVLRETETPGIVTFRHPIVRRAIYDATPPGRRLGAHRQAAGILQRRSAPVTVWAHHVDRSARIGDVQAASALTRAGIETAPRAPAAAARWFSAALRVLGPGGDAAQRVELLMRLAGALGTTGRIQEGEDALAQAVDLLPEEAVTQRSRLIAMRARAAQALGRGDDARRLLLAALERVPADSAEAGRLTLELAESLFMMRHWHHAAEVAEQARGLAERLGDAGLHLAATGWLAYVEQYRGADREAHAYAAILEGRSGYAAMADGEIDALMLEGLANLGYAEIGMEQYREAERCLRRGLAVCRASGQGYLFLRFMIGLAAGQLLRGRLHEARDTAETVAEAALLQRNDQATAIADGLRCWIAALQGDVEAALAAGARAVQAAERSPLSLHDWMAYTTYGEALAECGEPERAIDQLHRAGGTELLDVPPNARLHFRMVLAGCHVDCGRVDDADALVSWGEEHADRERIKRQPAADAALARARVLIARGHHDRAVVAARAAVAHYRAAGIRLWAGRAQLTAGMALALSPDPATAEADLREAHAIAVECGAVRLADQAAQALRRIGASVAQREVGHGAGPLSAREREVAERLARGETNRRIAAELFLSEKTVEKHVSRVFKKLGVTNRAAAAAAFARSSNERD